MVPVSRVLHARNRRWELYTLFVDGHLVQDQATTFDVVRALSDRSRRRLPCDRSRRPDAVAGRPNGVPAA